MLSTTQNNLLAEHFPELASDKNTWSELVSMGESISLLAGQHICLEGDTCSHLALLTEGTARIYKLGESGREITLYRVEPGGCCILTLSCILGSRKFPAFAVSESIINAVILPARTILDWMEKQTAWRQFAWDLVANRLTEVISLVEEITFRRMDERLTDHLLLLNEKSPDGMIHMTHQQIASDLGTSREVVSRLLKDLEAKKFLTLGRGWLKLNESQDTVKS